MKDYPRQLEILINELSKLPGVGEKSAQRWLFISLTGMRNR